jgi:hypothetical protein
MKGMIEQYRLHSVMYEMVYKQPNTIDAVNDLRARNGQEPVAIITPEDKAAKITHKKSIISHIKDSIECRKRGIPEENPFPETIEDKVRQIKELELEIKEIEAKTQ